MDLTDKRWRVLAELARRADCALTAAVSSRGLDGHGEPIEGLEKDLNNALNSIIVAADIAMELKNELTQ